MTNEDAAQYTRKLRDFVRMQPHKLGDADQQDAVQTVLVKILAHSADAVLTDAYLRTAAKNALLDLLKRRERSWFQLLSSERDTDEVTSLAMSPVDEHGHPGIVAAEVERRGRQQLLLSDILQEYALRCERQNMQTQREIYERRQRGQDWKLINSSMGVTRANIDQHLRRAREWIIDRMQQADVEKSVFQTSLCQKPDIPLPDTLPADVPRNFHEVLMRVINEVGALCPSDERLARFMQQPQADEFSDLRYHIEEVPCLLCQARRSL